MFKNNTRWYIVGLLFLVNIVNYLDRAALSIALPLIEKDLSITPSQFGIIFGSFFFGYALFNFVGGLASDRFGALMTLAMAVTVWSVFCGLTALSMGFFSLLALRILFGMAEGPVNAAGNKMISGWFSKKNAATAVGLLSAGSPLGGAIAGPVVGFLAIAVGWRFAFLIICCIGLAWVALWLFSAADNPSKSKVVTAEERRRIESEKERDFTLGDGHLQTKTAQKLSYYMKQPVILGTAFAFFSYNYILYFFLSWFPAYLVQAHGLDLKSMSIVTVIPWLVGFIGLSLGGYTSDFILRVTGRVFFSRKIILVTCLFAAAVCVGCAGMVKTVTPAVILMSSALFFLYSTGAIYWAIIQDVVHIDRVGGVGGAMHALANTSGMLGPVVTGYLVQNTGSFSSAFLLAGGITLFSVIIVFFCLKINTSPAGMVEEPKL